MRVAISHFLAEMDDRGRGEMPEWTHQVDMGMMSPAQASVAQLDRVLPSEGRGRGFESRRVHHIAV